MRDTEKLFGRQCDMQLGEINSNQLPIRSFAISRHQLISSNQQATESANDNEVLAYQRIVSKPVGVGAFQLPGESHWWLTCSPLELPANPNYRLAIVWSAREEEMVSRWARPATVLNSYSLLTGLRQRAVNAGCLFAAFITLPYHCLRRPVHGTCSRKMQIFETQCNSHKSLSAKSGRK